jgi:hypothetical protein
MYTEFLEEQDFLESRGVKFAQVLDATGPEDRAG